ncbi:unnamed protein product, partial [Pylaiella littoralis]
MTKGGSNTSFGGSSKSVSTFGGSGRSIGGNSTSFGSSSSSSRSFGGSTAEGKEAAQSPQLSPVGSSMTAGDEGARNPQVAIADRVVARRSSGSFGGSIGSSMDNSSIVGGRSRLSRGESGASSNLEVLSSLSSGSSPRGAADSSAEEE